MKAKRSSPNNDAYIKPSDHERGKNAVGKFQNMDYDAKMMSFIATITVS